MTFFQRALSVAFLLAAWPATASAQASGMADACMPAVDQAAPFDDRSHRLWYRRFWTGDCSGMFFCQAGEPNWNRSIRDFTQQAAPERRADLANRMCRIGHLIGHEWARDNGIRKIDTNDLTAFYKTLSSGTGDIDARLAQIETVARRKLAR